MKNKKKIIDGTFFKINKRIKKKIKANYHRIKDWVMDPKGYFLIKLNRKKNKINVGYCIFKKLGNSTENDMVAVIEGTTAIEIVNTLIKYEYISSLQHASDMGIELNKAEIALKYNLDYVQDKSLNILNKK